MVAKARVWRRARASKKSIVKTVKAVINRNVETKQLNDTFNQNATSTMVFHQLDTIALGTSDTSQRIGDTVKAQSIRIGYNCAVGDATNVLRVILFQWNETTTPSENIVLADTTSTVTKLLGGFSHDSIEGRLLRVIDDTVITLNGVAKPNYIWYKRYNLAKLRKTQFQSGNVFGIGNYYIGYMSDSGASTHPVLQAAWHLRYKDA